MTSNIVENFYLPGTVSISLYNHVGGRKHYYPDFMGKAKKGCKNFMWG